jgi:hypothetical protein
MGKYAFFVACGLLFSSVSAQITVTSTDVLNLIGNWPQFIAHDTLENETITVDIGSSGANQSWDYSSLTFPSQNFGVEYITPQGTPYFDTFPQSNFVQKMTLTGDTIEFNIYQYMKVSTDTLRFLGTWIQAGDFEQLEEDGGKEFAVLPLTYGTDWSISHIDTIGSFPGGAIVETDNVQVVIDAWGSITVPAGTFDCLRLHSEWQSIERWIVGDIVTYTDTSYGANISWISKNSMEAASFNFEYDGQTPQYTQADEVSLLLDIIWISIEENDKFNSNFQLHQNYPNPFNPITTIKFSLPQVSETTIEIFNINGQKVATALDQTLSAGPHEVTLNAGNLSSGVYLYRLSAGSFSATKKMIVIK